MPATEDSVLTSLNELRRLRKERQKKGHSGRGAGGRSHKAAVSAHDPMSDQVTPPPRSDLPAAKGPRHGGQAAMGQASRTGFSAPGLAAAPMAAAWNMPPDAAMFARMPRPTSSAKPAVIVAILLLGGAGVGYMKLQTDTQAVIAEKDATIRRVEEARAQAVEEAAKTERQAQVKLKACETRVESALTTAKAPTAPAAAPVIAPAAPAPTVASSAAGRNHHRTSNVRRGPSPASAAPAPQPQPTAIPNLPRKKKLDNDPLAGIKI